MVSNYRKRVVVMKFTTWRPEAYIAQTVSICSSFSCSWGISEHGRLPLKVLVLQPHTPVVVWQTSTVLVF